jgi:hypothetical protein
VRRVGDARKVQARHRIGQAQAFLFGGRHREAAPAVNAFGRNFITVAHIACGAVHRERADVAGDVAHVIAADHVVLVAHALRRNVARGQQQARGLQPARGQHRVARGDGELHAGQRAHLEFAHGLAVGLQPQRGAICAQQYLERGRQRQPLGIAGAEMGGAGKALQPVAEHARAVEAGDQRAGVRVQRLVRVIQKTPGLGQRIGARVVRQQVVV